MMTVFPCAVQYIRVAYLFLIGWFISLTLLPISPLPASLSLLVTTSLFLLAVNLFLFSYIHSFVLFLRVHKEVITYSICL